MHPFRPIRAKLFKTNLQVCPIRHCHLKVQVGRATDFNCIFHQKSIMSFPKFALYYFPDSDLVKVDSTDIILREHKRAEYQVKSREQLSSEEGYVEVRLPSRSRHGQSKILPAKLLLLGGKFIIVSD